MVAFQTPQYKLIVIFPHILPLFLSLFLPHLPVFLLLCFLYFVCLLLKVDVFLRNISKRM